MILVIDGWGISCEIALRWLSLAFTDDKSTLVQLIAGHRQATSQYLSQCWPSSFSPYGFTGPQWVNYMVLLLFNHQFISYWDNHNHLGAITVTVGQSQSHWGNHMIAPVRVKQLWRIWVKSSLSTTKHSANYHKIPHNRADSRLPPSQWETLLQSNAISHWLGQI